MNEKWFVATLLDFSLTQFVTTKWAKLLYTLCIIVSALELLSGALMALTILARFGFIAAVLIAGLCAVFVLAQLMLCRMLLEAIVVVFRIEEHARILAQKATSDRIV